MPVKAKVDLAKPAAAGTLAIAAKKRVGVAGTVHGLDASMEMLASAEKKARKAGVEVFFKNGVAEALPLEQFARKLGRAETWRRQGFFKWEHPTWEEAIA